MIKAIGEISASHKKIVLKVFESYNLQVEFVDITSVGHDDSLISFTKEATKGLEKGEYIFYNWDLLFSVLGPNDAEGEVEQKLRDRVEILKSIKNLKSRPIGYEFHGSIRVENLAESARFYTWLFGVEPKEWTHRYVTFHRKDARVNFVLLVSDGKELNHDTLYHLGMGVESKEKVVEFYHSANENGFSVEKPARTTWRGTPLHELWLKDPDGTLIEIYSRLTDEELKNMPDDKEPIFL